MKVQEPLHARLELRLHLFGAPLRIGPAFWPAAAAFGVIYYADPEIVNFPRVAFWLAAFAFWLAAVLASLLVHELGHVLMGRLFGMRGQVVLSGLGGLTLGIDELPRRWQRIGVLLGGPLASGLLVAGICGLTFLPPTPAAWGPHAALAIGFAEKWLLDANVFWTAVNLLPLWPLDGGRVACEIGEGLFGPRGAKVALVLSLATTVLLTFLATALLSTFLNIPFDVPFRVPEWIRKTQTARLWHIECGVLILYCYLLWIRTFRALWPEAKDRESDAPTRAKGS
jgi:stage IV sporulation protein FB